MFAQAADPSWFHLLPGQQPAVFLTRGSMLFDITDDMLAALLHGDASALNELRAYDTEPVSPAPASAPIAALSLNVAQTCNLACAYCYADEGRFGGRPRVMQRGTAFRAIERLMAQADGRATIGFIGGEPFLNRQLIHDCVGYAKSLAIHTGLRLGFAVTTNATMLAEEDLKLLREEGFAVTVSIDGGPGQNTQRRTRRGLDSTDAVLSAIRPLLADPGRARVAARATVTRDNLSIAERIEWLGGAGFHDVGVSPARSGPRPDLLITADDWPILLDRMIEAADRELTRVFDGTAPRFSNLWVALRAIHRGAGRPLPCGSAASYLSVGADGTFHSCHRTIDDPHFSMGSVDDGFDNERRRQFLEQRAVDRQEPCRSCWARYLCGGGCHAEVVSVGRSGCDYIRGWLDYCLRVYRMVAEHRPMLLLRGET